MPMDKPTVGGQILEVEFKENQPISFVVDPGGQILKQNFILKGEIKVTGGTTSGVKAGDGAPAGLIQSITVDCFPAPGSKYPRIKAVDECTPRGLITWAAVQREGKFVRELSGSTLGDGAAATYDIYYNIPVYFADPNFRRQVATALNAEPGAYQKIQVTIQTGSLADCFTGNDRAVDYSGLKIQYADERENLQGDTVPMSIEEHVSLIDAAQKKYKDGSMPNDGSFLQWLIFTETGSTTVATLADTVLNELVIDAPALDRDDYWQDIRQRMIDDGWFDPSSTLTGIFLVDFTDGLLSKALSAVGLKAKFDVKNPSGSNNDALHFLTRRVFSLNG